MSGSPRHRVLLSWSSGKDSAWCLHGLRQNPNVEVVGLLTTVNREADRVAMHGVRRALLEQQANRAGLPLTVVELPWPCSNVDYETALRRGLDSLSRKMPFDEVAFGDLYLEDVRTYRETQMSAWGYACRFPLWGLDTRLLSREMVDAGLQAIITCVDPAQGAEPFLGRNYDHALLDELPPSIDPCGENGEFHTLVTAGPMFVESIPVRAGRTVSREGFDFADVLPI